MALLNLQDLTNKYKSLLSGVGNTLSSLGNSFASRPDPVTSMKGMGGGVPQIKQGIVTALNTIKNIPNVPQTVVPQYKNQTVNKVVNVLATPTKMTNWGVNNLMDWVREPAGRLSKVVQGQPLSTAEKVYTGLDIASVMPIGLMAGAVKGVFEANKLRAMAPEIKSTKSLLSGYEYFNPAKQIETLNRVEETLAKIGVKASPQLKRLMLTSPDEYMNFARGLLEDATYAMGHPELRLGLSTKVLKRTTTQSKLPIEAGKEKLATTLAKQGASEVAGRISSAPSKVSELAKVEGQLPQQFSDSLSRIISPKDKYAYNINLNKLALKPQEKGTLKKSVEIASSELQKIKGKALSNQEVVEAAKTSEILQKTTTREATLQAEAAMLKARQKLVDLDKQVSSLAKGGNTPELRAKISDLVESLKVVSSNAAEKGRQLQALSIEATDESLRQKILKDILKTEVDTNKVIEEASKVNWDSANEVYKFYRSFIKPTSIQILDEFRYNNMLSNPRTHIRNAFSNLVQTFITRPATILAQGKVKGTAQYYGGVMKSFPEAVKAFGDSFSGKSVIAKPDIEFAPTLKLPKLLTVPTRAMEAADKFFSALIRGGEVARGSTHEQAGKIAEYSLFRQGLKPEGQGAVLNMIDNFTQGMYSFGEKFKPIRWFVPFIRTPMNFAKQWVEYSPLGFSTAIGAGNKGEQIAKAMVGSVITALGAKVALDDRTTWSAPTDPKQKELFYASGRKPFSVKIGDRWVSMQYLGPFGLAVAIPAAMKFYQDESRTALTDTQMEKLGQSLMGVAEFFSGQTFLEGINNFVKLASGDIDYTLPKNIAYTASQTIPLQGLLRWVSTIIDPVYRKPAGAIQQIQQNIPFASQSLPAYTTPTGEPSVRERLNLITPYDITKDVPSYGPLLQQRTSQLQQNALINQAKKVIELAKSGSRQIGNTLIYWNADKNTVSTKTIKETAVPKTTKAKKPKKVAIKKVKVPKIKLAKVKKVKIAKAKVKKLKKYTLKVKKPKLAKLKVSAKLT